MPTTTRHAPILFVEDNPTDAAMVQHALEKLHLLNPVTVLTTGEAAIAHLTKAATGDPAAPLPVLALVDLGLPGTSGQQVLGWIKSQPATCKVPVAVLTASHNSHDVDSAFRAGADAYVLKPASATNLLELLWNLRMTWALEGRAGK
jgi:CheY-like chemotaxis protein